MHHPFISIVIPSLNQGKFIRQTLDSIFFQNYSNVEIIVMDGGSKDGTVQILKEYELRVKKYAVPIGRQELREQRIFKWVSKKDKGQADAINKGMKMAKGKIVGFINSDDFYETNVLQNVMAFFAKNSSLMWMTGDCRIVDEKGKEIQRFVRLYKKFFRMVPFSMVLPVLNPIAQPSTFWRREVFSEIGYFDESLRYTFDYDFWLRMMHLPYVVIGETLSSFRIHGASKGGKEYKKQFEEEEETAKRYVHNSIVRLFHHVHARAITYSYDLIK